MNLTHRRTLANGRSDTRRKQSRRTAIDGPFVAYRREMLESPAFRALSHSALRILHRLEIEHMAHAGTENGNLICTYQDFVDYGVSMGAIKPALSQLVALGFIQIEIHGRRSSGGVKIPSRYRLTYLREGGVDAKPTDEWAKMDEQAVLEAMAALEPTRAPRSADARQLPRPNYGSTQVALVGTKRVGGVG